MEDGGVGKIMISFLCMKNSMEHVGYNAKVSSWKETVGLRRGLETYQLTELCKEAGEGQEHYSLVVPI